MWTRTLRSRCRYGPLPTYDVKVSLRITPDLAARLNAWIGDRPDAPTRAEAIRRLIEIGLKDAKADLEAFTSKLPVSSGR